MKTIVFPSFWGNVSHVKTTPKAFLSFICLQMLICSAHQFVLVICDPPLLSSSSCSTYLCLSVTLVQALELTFAPASPPHTTAFYPTSYQHCAYKVRYTTVCISLMVCSIHPSHHFLYPFNPIQGREWAGAYPSCHWARGRVHPG